MLQQARRGAVAAVLLALAASGWAQQRAPALEELAASVAKVVATASEDEAAARTQLGQLLSGHDGWLVADHLRMHGQLDVATRFSELIEGPDLAGLATHLKSIGDTPPDARARAALAAVETAGAVSDCVAAIPARFAAVWALSGARGSGDGFEQARVALARGDAYLQSGDYEKAAGACDDAARRCRTVGWLSGANGALRRRLLAARRSRAWSVAEDSSRRMIAVETERGMAARAAQSTVNLGHVLLSAGDIREATAQYERAVDALGGLRSRALGRAQWALGRAYLRGGRYREAEFSLEDAVATLLDDGQKAMARRAELLLAEVELQLGRGEEALETQRRIVESARESSDSGVLALAIGGVGRSLSDLRRFDEAGAPLAEARRLFVADGKNEQACQVLTNLANLAERRGDLETARELYASALAEAETVADPYLECAILQDLALVEHRVGQVERAYETLARADELAAELASADLSGGGAFRRCRMALADADADSAVVSARLAIAAVGESIQGLTAGQSAVAREYHAEVYSLAVEAAVAAQDAAALFDFLEAGRAGTLLESLEERDLVRSATITEELLGDLEQATRAEALATAEFRVLASRRTETPLRKLAAARAALDAATAARTAAVKAIQREASLAADLLYPEFASLPEAQEALARDEAIVLFGLLETNAFALVVEHEAARIVALGSTSAIIELCVAPQWRSPDESADTVIAALRRLTIDSLGLPAHCRKLLVSADGALHQVPLPALGGDREVSLVPSATTYLRLREREDRNGSLALVVGDPDYGTRPLRQLKGARAEAQSFQRGEGGDIVLIGKDATESTVRKELASGRAWRVVHLAAHGHEDNQRPMQSGIALTADEHHDGWLTAEEVFTLSLHSKLVTLSACESGGGRVYRGEGLVGLTRAFLFAGSQRVVCSLWRVDDQATGALMKRFYELHEGSGQSVAAALAGAQRHVRLQKGWEHPYYWAAWTVWGLGS